MQGSSSSVHYAFLFKVGTPSMLTIYISVAFKLANIAKASRFDIVVDIISV